MNKMKTWPLLILFLLASKPASAQQINLDSFFTIWKDQTKSDSIRASAFREYIWEGFLYTNPDTAAILSDELIAFGVEKAKLQIQASGFNIKGASYSVIGDTHNALDAYNHGLKIYEQMGDKRGMSSVLNNLGLIYNEQGNGLKALEAYTRSLEIVEQLGDQERIAGTLNNLGNIYVNQGNRSKALDYYNRSLKIYQQLGNQKGIADELNNLGNVYKRQIDYPKALDNYIQSLKIYKALGNKPGIAMLLGNIGNIYFEQKDYSKAMDYLKQRLKIEEEVGNQKGEAHTLITFGLIYIKQNEHSKALSYCQKGYEMAISLGVILEEKDACKCLYDVYKAIGKPKQALEYYEKMIVLRDSIYNEENTKKITQLEMQYEFDIKEAKAAEELQQQKLLRNGFIVGFVFVLLFAGIFWKQRNRIGKEKQRSEELLLNILPKETAKELKEKGHSDAQLIDQVTVLFTDFKGFTALSEKVTPKALVADLHECFSAFDLLCQKYGIEKIKTIGDAYMAAGGLPTPNKTHAQDIVKMALEMAHFVEKGKAKKIEAGLPFFEIRIGVHTGPVVAGIVGIKKFQYDIWGDTVNTASRMESSGEAGKVNVSQTTYELLNGHQDFEFEGRGKIVAKGKGELEMYFVKLSQRNISPFADPVPS